MRYISDDGKIFNTETECTKYENDLEMKNRKREEERLRKEKLEKEKQKRFESIRKHQEELNEEIRSFQYDYGCMIPVSPLDFILKELLK